MKTQQQQYSLLKWGLLEHLISEVERFVSQLACLEEASRSFEREKNSSGAATNAATGEKASARGARGREDEDAASEPDASTEEIARPEGDAKLTADNGGCDADKTSSHGQPCDTEDAASSATTSGGVITFEDRMRLILEEKGLIERGAILPFEQARLETASRSPPSRARVRRR